MYIDINQIKNQLERRLEELTGEMRQARGHLRDAPSAIHVGSEGNTGEIDSGSSGTEVVLENLGRAISAVTNALRRIGDGMYGMCEVCEEPITSRRLRAIPTTTMCIGCQREEERLGRRDHSMREVLDSMKSDPDNE